METNPLTPAEARAHLDAARAAETATRFPSVPSWLIGANAVLLPLLVLSQLTSSRQPTTSLAIVIIVLNLVTVSYSGVVQGSYSSTFWGTVSTAAALAVVIGGSFALYALTDSTWVVVAAAVVTGLLVAAIGLLYHRSSR